MQLILLGRRQSAVGDEIFDETVVQCMRGLQRLFIKFANPHGKLVLFTIA